jgi:uncharacterized Zn finger protein
LEQWDDLQPQVLAFLKQSGKTALLLEIHLDENEIDRALELVAPKDTAVRHRGLALEVAHAAERSHPRESLDIYRDYAESLVGRGGREDYAEACRYLLKARTLADHVGIADEWADYIAELRRRHSGSAALLAEMDAAGL